MLTPDKSEILKNVKATAERFGKVLIKINMQCVIFVQVVIMEIRQQWKDLFCCHFFLPPLRSLQQP